VRCDSRGAVDSRIKGKPFKDLILLPERVRELTVAGEE
jgi:hypothetical protein